MENLILILGISALLSIVFSPLMAGVALHRSGRLERELRAVRRQLDEAARPARPEPEPPAEEAAPASEAEPAPAEPPAQEDETPPEPEEPPPIAAEPPAAAAAAAPARGARTTAASLEETVAARWMVWLGSLALGLGGIFLVKFGIDHNILSPGVRVLLGCVLGVALAGGGEWLRQRPMQRAIAAVRPDYVPPALTAAGIASAFGSIYAGYALYDLLPALVVFAGLSAIAMAALALSILQGPFIAAMGILGAFAVPLLVETPDPSAWALFSYLLFVAVAALAVLRYRDWGWLAWCTLAGSVLWQLLWLLRPWQAPDILPLGLHLIVLLALFIAVRFETLRSGGDESTGPFAFARMLVPQRIALGAAVSVAAVVFLLAKHAGHDLPALTVFGTVMVMLVATAWAARLEALLPLAAAATLAMLADWHVPGIRPLFERDFQIATVSVFPPGFARFIVVSVLTGTVFGGIGYAGIRRSRTPGLWAAVSASVPLLVYALAYWRMSAIVPDATWGAIGLALAALATWVTAQVSRGAVQDRFDAAIGCYALAVIGAISLAATMIFDHSWLTIALAIQLPAMGWVHERMGIRHLRLAALVIAAIVAFRLVFLNYLPGVPLQIRLDAFWILYSYGIPAACFALAARAFRRVSDDWLVTVLESAAIATALALISMEIRRFAGTGALGFSRYTLLEQSLHSISWLASGYWLYRRNRIMPRVTSLWGARILLSLATAQIVLLQTIVSNPLLSRVDVGLLPLLGVISLAYGVPAVFAALIHREALHQGHLAVARTAGALALGLLFVDLTLEVRHLFHGRYLHTGRMSDAEGYAYSLAWLLYAGALLALGILRRVTELRYASLGLILLVVAKVFLWDMAWLTGLYRVGSFLGLGLSLVLVGYLYQRFVFRPQRHAAGSG